MKKKKNPSCIVWVLVLHLITYAGFMSAQFNAVCMDAYVIIIYFSTITHFSYLF